MTTVARGRPLASSRETLADAASELFLEQGYEATTVAHITRRAGVSRSSFFNYFDGKAATIWFALDATLGQFAAPTTPDKGAVEREAQAETGGAQGASAAGTRGCDLEELASALAAAPLHTLALAITNAEVMGVAAELETGRALRQASLGRLLAGETRRREPGSGSLECELAGAVQAAAVFAAIWRWAERGSGIHRLDEEISSTLRAVPAGPGGRTGPIRVAVVGSGAIGSRVIGELAAGRVAGATLSGVVTRRAGALGEALGERAFDVTDFGQDLERAIAESDVVVECAGITAAHDVGARVVAAGRTLLLVSIGVLADPNTRAALAHGPGTLRLATGAIGGLDLLASAARPGGIPSGIERAGITSTKEAETLVQPWMGDEEAERLRRTDIAFTLFEGSVTEAVELYPGSLNVACALAHATGLWEGTRVRLIADPHARRTTHEITADGAAGEYRFVMSNAVSDANPTSSAVVAESVLRAVGELARPSASFA